MIVVRVKAGLWRAKSGRYGAIAASMSLAIQTLFSMLEAHNACDHLDDRDERDCCAVCAGVAAK